MKKLFFILIMVVCLGIPSKSGANDTIKENHPAEEHPSEEAFNPGEFIIEHIGDSYEWHILHVGKFQLSVPLPVILISKTSGFHFFMASEFHHGHSAYKSFQIPKEGENKGKIVEVIDGKEVRPYDFSITKNVLALFVSLGLLLFIFLRIAQKYTKNPDKAPSGLQNALEPIILFIRDDVAKPAIGHRYEKYLPYLLTIFFFILLNNLMGLIPIIPGGANVTGNIAITLVLALMTFVITTFSTDKHYWIHIVNAPGVPWWLKFPIPLMPIVEIIGVFNKPFVLMVRLFANITAGHIIALGFFSLIFIFGKLNIYAGYGISVISVAFTIFMSMLELLVAFIQAYVFTLLSALYFGMASSKHH